MVRDHEHDTDGIALDERVSSLLSAAAAPSEPGPLPGEGAALAAFRAAQPSRRSPHRPVLVAARSGMAAVVAGLLLTGGVAAATAGVLPGIAQDTVDGVLVDLGLGPAADDSRQEQGTGTGAPETLEPTGTTTGDPGDPGDSADFGESGTGEDAAAHDATGGGAAEVAAHGKEVSRTARETEATGAAKGAEISGVASQGRSRAGEERRAVRRDDTAVGRGRPVEAEASRDVLRRLPGAAHRHRR